MNSSIEGNLFIYIFEGKEIINKYLQIEFFFFYYLVRLIEIYHLIIFADLNFKFLNFLSWKNNT